MAKRATSECARFTELAPGTTWITALIIARQRREERRSALKRTAHRGEVEFTTAASRIRLIAK
jgi:hypothetical protein